MSFLGCHQLGIQTQYNSFTATEDSTTLGSDMSAAAGLRGARPNGIFQSRLAALQRTETGTIIISTKPSKNHNIKYNLDVLERDYLPEEKDLRREENTER